MSVRDYSPPLICAGCGEPISESDNNAGRYALRDDGALVLHPGCAPAFDAEYPALNLDAIEARASAATPGPWATMRLWPLNIVPADQAGLAFGASVDPIDDRRRYAQAIAVSSHDAFCPPEFTHRRNDIEQARVDADFIAHARSDVPALVAEIRRLRLALTARERRAV